MTTQLEVERRILHAIDRDGALYCAHPGCRVLVSGKTRCDEHNGLPSRRVAPVWPPPWVSGPEGAVS